MFDRYTEKARRAIFFARYAASEFGSTTIEAEFLFLGLLQADPHAVTHWLDHKATAYSLSEEISKHISKAPRISTSVDLPLSEEARRILGYATEEAATLSHSYIGSEHLLLGSLRDPQSHLAKILRQLGIDAKTIRENIVREGTPPSGPHDIAVTSASGGIHHARPVQIMMLPEQESTAIHLSWHERIPAVGEIITMDRSPTETQYEVLEVEWKISSVPSEEAFLSQVVLHVRAQRQASGDRL